MAVTRSGGGTRSRVARTAPLVASAMIRRWSASSAKRWALEGDGIVGEAARAVGGVLARAGLVGVFDVVADGAGAASRAQVAPARSVQARMRH